MNVAYVYEDPDLLVVDKPPGLASTPGKLDNLCALLFALRPELLKVRGFKANEGGLLNRLDNETGGLVLFAKTQASFRYYAEEMRQERIIKNYYAVVAGVPAEEAGSITLLLGHARKSSRRMAIAEGKNAIRGRPLPARTDWRLVETQPPFSLLDVSIAKGARHQIRIHLAASGFPIVGDKLYNKKTGSKAMPNHLLYCYRVQCTLMNGEKKLVETEVPFLKNWKLIVA